MPKIHETFDTQHAAQKRIAEILSDQTTYVKKIDLRSVDGKYKLIAVSYPNKEDEA